MDNILVFFGKMILTIILATIAGFRSAISYLFGLADSIGLYFVRHVNKLEDKVQENIKAYEEYVAHYKVEGPKAAMQKRQALGHYLSRIAELRTINRK